LDIFLNLTAIALTFESGSGKIGLNARAQNVVSDYVSTCLLGTTLSARDFFIKKLHLAESSSLICPD